MSAMKSSVAGSVLQRDTSEFHRPTAGVNLRRSKTSVGTTSSQHHHHHRGAPTMQTVARSYSTAPQFRPFVARYRQADIPLPAAHSHYKRVSRAAEPGNQFCEFQAAPSFHLPNMDVLKRAVSSGKSDISKDRWDEDGKSSTILFDGDDPHSPRYLFGDSIRYQGVDTVSSSALDRNNNNNNNINNNNNNRARQKSLMRNYYSSWEDLLEKSEIAADRSNLARRHHYGSTESINSSGSEGSKQHPMYAYQKQAQQELIQAAAGGHHLQLHAVHNQTYQTSSILKPCPEQDQEERDAAGKLYDIPRMTAPGVMKSNSRVCSSGKLCLRVESFKEKKSDSDPSLLQRRSSNAAPADSAQYAGGVSYQKSPARQVILAPIGYISMPIS